MKPFDLVKPCAQCPFRSDIRPFLHPDRVVEFESALAQSLFYCHKTIDYSKKACGRHFHPDRDNSACAGSLILLEKIDQPSQMMRIAERLGLYNRTTLDMDAPVFDSFEEMRDAMEGEVERSRRRKK